MLTWTIIISNNVVDNNFLFFFLKAKAIAIQNIKTLQKNYVNINNKRA